MTAPLRIALVKPDWGFRGGGEIVIDRVVALLEDAGHRVERHQISIPALPRAPFGLRVPDRVWESAPEYFRHLAALDAVQRVDVGAADLVLSTQPPSYAVDHPRHLSFFLHHQRVFYDLSDVFVAAGFAPAEELHRAAEAHVRRIEQPLLERVSWFCTNSERVQDRLGEFNGIDRSSVLYTGGGVEGGAHDGASAEPGQGPVLCVSRHEFPKRTELFVHAMKYRPSERGVLVGSGGRLRWVKGIDGELSRGGVDLDAIIDKQLWLNRGDGRVPPFGRRTARAGRSNVRFAERVSQRELVDLYRSASCVVTPAYDEDYGLTALEAMSYGRPVVACRDGGGLATFLRNGENGLLVEPCGRAIGEAMGRLVDDPDLARRLGENGMETAAGYTWERGAAELRRSVERVAG